MLNFVGMSIVVRHLEGKYITFLMLNNEREASEAPFLLPRKARTLSLALSIRLAPRLSGAQRRGEEEEGNVYLSRGDNLSSKFMYILLRSTLGIWIEPVRQYIVYAFVPFRSGEETCLNQFRLGYMASYNPMSPAASERINQSNQLLAAAVAGARK